MTDSMAPNDRPAQQGRSVITLEEFEALAEDVGDEEAGRIISERLRQYAAQLPPADFTSSKDALMLDVGDEPDLIREEP